mmetsp:Transcript_44871/g.112833  ORF Transcript_44871/g.112833 Transcript_44871/m.112833 type:complete len:218 (+) Transcript_44871:188-841(+)
MDGPHEHAITPDNFPVLRQVGASEVIVLLECHPGVEPYGRPIRHEEVAEDEVIGRDCFTGEGLPSVAQGKNPGEPRPGRLALLGCRLRRPQLREKEAGSRHGRDAELLRRLGRSIARFQVHLFAQLADIVVPTGNVVGHLHAWLACARRVAQRQIPSRHELPADLCAEPQSLVSLQTGLVHVPSWVGSARRELRLDAADVAQALLIRCTARRHHGEE